MTTRLIETPRLTGDYTFPNPLPKPLPRPHSMQQEPTATEIRATIRHHFSDRPDVFVSGEGYLCFDTRDRVGWLIPDCVVAFGVDPRAIFRRNGYVISEVGKPPDFIIEVASSSTGAADYTTKRDRYSEYGAIEYWRFDPTGGAFHDQPLAGDTLVDGEYQPIPLRYEPDGVIRGHSSVLGLDLCWVNGRLRFYDPASGEYLRNISEAEARAHRMEAERAEAEARAHRMEAERAEAEARAHRMEAERAEAEARAHRMEAEVRRLREELRRMRSE